MVSALTPSSLFWTALRASTVRRKRLPVATRGWTAPPLRPLAFQGVLTESGPPIRGPARTQDIVGTLPGLAA